MKSRLNILLGGLGLFILQGCKASQGGQARQPNVIYVFPDQYCNQAMEFWDRESFRGRVNFRDDSVHAPRLNDFARESMVLTSAISNCPLGSPHRNLLSIGTYPNKSGVPLNCNSNRPIGSSCADVDCVSGMFNDTGCDCAYSGKLHTNFPTPNNPQWSGKYVEDRIPVWDAYTPKERRHGFNYQYPYGIFDEHKNPHYWDTDDKCYDLHEWSPLYKVGKVVSYLRSEGNARDPKKPFSIMVGMNPPYSLYRLLDNCMEQDSNLYKDRSLDSLLIRPSVDPEMIKTEGVCCYFALVTGANRAFGQILDILEELELSEDTTVVFSSDRNGATCSRYMSDPKNSPFSESMSVPFIVRFPGKIKPRLDDLMLSSSDITPALLGLAGSSGSVPVTVQGHNYALSFLDEKVDVVYPTGVPYVQSLDGGKGADGKVRSYFPASRGSKSARYTLAFYIDRDSWKLVKSPLLDDRNDPYQMNGLPLEEDKDVVDGLCVEMGKVLKEVDDPWYRKRTLSDMIPCGR